MSTFRFIQQSVSHSIKDRGIEEQFQHSFHLTSLFFSQLAYFSHSYTAKKLAEISADEYNLYNSEGTQGLFARFGDTAVVSFRGTEPNKWSDIKTILRFWKKDVDGIRVHSGFISSLNNVVESARNDIEKANCTNNIYTGHSMGGGLATLLAYQHNPTSLCTFGEPKVSGGDLFRERMSGFRYDRIVAKHDWIRFLPFGIPRLMEYHHCGEEMLLPSKWNWKSWTEPHYLSTYNNLLLHT